MADHEGTRRSTLVHCKQHGRYYDSAKTQCPACLADSNMTSPTPSQPTDLNASAAQAPTGVRIASSFCWVVGIINILVALARGLPAISTGRGALFLAVNLLAGGAVCVAAVLIRRQRRLGVLVLALAWALGGRPLFLLVVLLFAGANWKHFR